MSKALLNARINTLINKGRKEVANKKELEKFPIGSMISYINIDGAFRHGGFITKFTKDYFVYISPDFKTKHKGKYNRIARMCVGTVYDTINDLVSIRKTDKPKTKYPVKVKDIVVYYAKENLDAERYKFTEKYKRMILWIKYFEDNSDSDSE